jgi:hypothetical protein
VNSAMMAKISNGDLMAARLWANSKANCCWLVRFREASLDKPARMPWLKKNQSLSLDRYPLSSDWSHLGREAPDSQQ